jgi:hypothetical protein
VLWYAWRAEQNRARGGGRGKWKTWKNPEPPRSLPDLTSVSAKACSSLTHWWIWRSA